MAKGKRGRAAQAARYRNVANGGSSAPRHQNRQQDVASHFLPRAATTHSFSMADAARNTANNHGNSGDQGDQGEKLRGRPVTFVSAGVVEPLKDLEEIAVSHDDEGDLPLDDAVDAPTSEHPPRFFIDITGDQSLSRRQGQPVHNPSPLSRTSTSDSDSGEDVVLFRGRNSVRLPESNPCPAVVDEVTIQISTVEKTLQHISLETTGETSHRHPSPSLPKPWMLRGCHDEDDLVADYIANMANDDEEDEEESAVPYNPFFIGRDLGGSDDEFALAEESGTDASPVGDEEDGNEGEDEDEDEDDKEDSPKLSKLDGSANGGTGEIDDETLARLLAKQEELGMGSDELDLFSAEVYGEVLQSGDRASRRGNSAKGKKNARGPIPSAGAVADVFDDLDLMDWNRHNPPRQPKKRRGQPNFDISDSDLEATLQATFQKDRLRKSERKKEREELRAQGLLGKHALNPDDLRVKYPTGMTLDQIKEEMRAFLQGTDQLLTFPPMDSHARKTVHELSLRFNVKSKSVGKSEQRRPVLHRTKRTVKYRHFAFEEVFDRQQGRKFFHRMDKDRPSRGPGGGSALGRQRGGVNHAAFTYKDGEVVGGGAPELGQSNKGRAMLEKMGWATGMALGATDNKGILQPVAHVVKRTKAGLG